MLGPLPIPLVPLVAPFVLLDIIRMFVVNLPVLLAWLDSYQAVLVKVSAPAVQRGRINPVLPAPLVCLVQQENILSHPILFLAPPVTLDIMLLAPAMWDVNHVQLEHSATAALLHSPGPLVLVFTWIKPAEQLAIIVRLVVMFLILVKVNA